MKIKTITSDSKFSEIISSSNFTFFIAFILNAFFQGQGTELIDPELLVQAGSEGLLSVIQYTFPVIILFLKKAIPSGFNKAMFKNQNFWITILTAVLFLLKYFGLDLDLDTSISFFNALFDGSWAQAFSIGLVLFNIGHHAFLKPKKYPKKEELQAA